MENGPASPGRWQTWQFLCNMGAMSLVKVGAAEPGEFPDWPRDKAVESRTTTKSKRQLFIREMPPKLDMNQREYKQEDWTTQGPPCGASLDLATNAS